MNDKEEGSAAQLSGDESQEQEDDNKDNEPEENNVEHSEEEEEEASAAEEEGEEDEEGEGSEETEDDDDDDDVHVTIGEISSATSYGLVGNDGYIMGALCVVFVGLCRQPYGSGVGGKQGAGGMFGKHGELL